MRAPSPTHAGFALLASLAALLGLLGCDRDAPTLAAAPGTLPLITETTVDLDTGQALDFLETGGASLCSDIFALAESGQARLSGTILQQGSTADEAPPGVCSWASQYLSFVDEAGVEHTLGWFIDDASGNDITPAIAAPVGAEIQLNLSWTASAHTHTYSLGAFDAHGELLLAMATGPGLDPADIAPLAVEWDPSPMGVAPITCGRAAVHPLVFSSESTRVGLSLGVGESGRIRVGETDLIAISLNATRLVQTDCTDISPTYLHWAVWRP